MDVEAPVTDSAPEMGVTFQYVPWRGISEATQRFFGVSAKVSAEGEPIAFAAPFGESKQIRLAKEKKIWWQGFSADADLFGWDKFEAGGKDVTIYESWIDAESGYEILGRPSVAVRSASTAAKDCKKKYEWLNSFDKIYLAFDSDEPGQRAAQAVARMFDFNKVFHVRLAKKDCNEYLTSSEEARYRETWYSAKRFLPEGIISSLEDFYRIIDVAPKKGVPYPFPTWTEKTDGIRTGELILLSADEGVGKTEVLRTIQGHLLETTADRLGIVHLEEDHARELKGLAGMALGVPAHLSGSPVSNEEIKSVIKRYADGDRLHLYSHFDTDDLDTLLDCLRFLAGPCGCRRLFLDPLSALVADLDTDNERRKLDYLAEKFARIAKTYDTTFFLSAHVNNEGRIRGSTYPSKKAHVWFHLDRNPSAEDEEARNTTFVTVKKNRPTGRTGPAGALTFNPETFRIQEKGKESSV